MRLHQTLATILSSRVLYVPTLLTSSVTVASVTVPLLTLERTAMCSQPVKVFPVLAITAECVAILPPTRVSSSASQLVTLSSRPRTTNVHAQQVSPALNARPKWPALPLPAKTEAPAPTAQTFSPEPATAVPPTTPVTVVRSRRRALPTVA